MFFFFVFTVSISRKEFEELSAAVFEMHAMISKANVQRFSATAREFHNKVVARAFGEKKVPCLEHEDVTALNTVISSVQLSTVMFCFCSCQSVCSINVSAMQ